MSINAQVGSCGSVPPPSWWPPLICNADISSVGRKCVHSLEKGGSWYTQLVGVRLIPVESTDSQCTEHDRMKLVFVVLLEPGAQWCYPHYDKCTPHCKQASSAMAEEYFLHGIYSPCNIVRAGHGKGSCNYNRNGHIHVAIRGPHDDLTEQVGVALKPLCWPPVSLHNLLAQLVSQCFQVLLCLSTIKCYPIKHSHLFILFFNLWRYIFAGLVMSFFITVNALPLLLNQNIVLS